MSNEEKKTDILTVDERIDILDKYSKKRLAVKFNDVEFVKAFYELNKIKIRKGTKTLNIYFKSISDLFNPNVVDKKQFGKVLRALVRLFKYMNLNINTLLASKAVIKKNLLKHIKQTDYENDDYFRLWLKTTLPVQDSEFKLKKGQANKALETKVTNVYQMPESDFMKYVNELGGSENVIDMIVLAQLNVGARLIEILNPAVSYFSIDPENPKLIIQNGIAKEKIGNDECVSATASSRTIDKLPILVTPKNFIKNINYIRKEIHEDIVKAYNNRELTNLFAFKINKRIKEILKKLKIPYSKEITSSHGARRLYVAWVYYKSDKKKTKSYLIKKLLGHKTDGCLGNYDSVLIV